jgi:outer membrane biosynthesis protein TonB
MQVLRIVVILVTTLACCAPLAHAEGEPSIWDANFVADPADADATPGLASAWTLWREGIKKKLLDRFETELPPSDRYRQFDRHAIVRLQITADGRVECMQMISATSSLRLNMLVVQSVENLKQEKAALKFPDGSRRKSVSMTVTFKLPKKSGPFSYFIAD